MNRIFNVLTIIFAVLGVVTGALYLFLDMNIIRYVLYSTIGFYLSDTLRELTFKHKRRNIVVLKSFLRIIITVVLSFVLVKIK